MLMRRRSEAQAEEIYVATRVRTTKGRMSRIVFAGAAGGLATMAVDWRFVIAHFAAVLAWETFVPAYVYSALDRIARKASHAIALRHMAAVALCGSLIYSSYAAMMFTGDSVLAAYLALAWLMGMLLLVHLFYSNSSLMLATQVAAPSILLLMQPFVWLENWGEAVAAAFVLLLLLVAMSQFSRDRYELLDKVAQVARDKQAAEAASAAKSQFLAVMTHELRTPLNAIIGYSEIMREDAEADGRDLAVNDHDRVLGAAHRLLHLINAVLDLTKIEQGRAELEIAEHDVTAMLNDVAGIVRPLAAENGNEFAVEMAGYLGRVRTDGFKLSQCLLNLASNAAKFTRNGRIVLRARRTVDRLVLEVSDTGMGIPEEKIDQLFQPFTQADASITRNFGGTGLGLAITRRMARLLGGDVGVSSVAGAGSTFTLTVATDLKSEMAEEEAAPPALNLAAVR